MNELSDGWLIYQEKEAKRNESYIKWFIEEAKEQKINLRLIIREKLHIGIVEQARTIFYKNAPVQLPTFAVVRTVEPLLNKHLELLGINVFNSAKVSAMSNHKAVTYTEMNRLDIPIVNTIFTKKDYLCSTPPMEIPFVIKESTGRGGKQVFFIHSDNEWNKIYQSFTTDDLVIQSANVQLGKDLRVFVIGKEIIGAVLRESKGDFRANYNLGGTATWYNLSNRETKLINKIVNAHEFDLVGIDFLIDLDGNLLLNEIEDVVGSRILSAVSDVNILKKYVTHIQSKL